MTTNPYKNFIPYLVSSDAKTDDLDLDLHRSKEPSGGQWRSIGLINALPGEGLLVDMDGGKMMCVQFNERILPGKVRDEHLGKRVAKLEQMEGRKLSKKEYAQLREQVEFDLLPRAFVRRTNVPVIFMAKPANVAAVEHYIRDELARLFPNVKFCVYDTSDPSLENGRKITVAGQLDLGL